MTGRRSPDGAAPHPPQAEHAEAKGTLVFSHANGFPAGTYRGLFDRWRAAGWRIISAERFGHDPAFPVTSNWPRLRDQLIALVDSQGGGGPVYLVGHSLGGYLSLLAACRRPDLAQGVVLLDSPVVAGWRAHGVQVAKATGLIKRKYTHQGLNDESCWSRGQTWAIYGYAYLYEATGNDRYLQQSLKAAEYYLARKRLFSSNKLKTITFL